MQINNFSFIPLLSLQWGAIKEEEEHNEMRLCIIKSEYE